MDKELKEFVIDYLNEKNNKLGSDEKVIVIGIKNDNPERDAINFIYWWHINNGRRGRAYPIYSGYLRDTDGPLIPLDEEFIDINGNKHQLFLGYVDIADREIIISPSNEAVKEITIRGYRPCEEVTTLGEL